MEVAIFHYSIKVISRSQGRSIVACAAYRAGVRLVDHDTGKVHDFTRKGGVIYSEILLPSHAPESYNSRQTLWDSVSKVECKSNSQLAREVEMALPKELSREKQIELVRSYIKAQFISKGMCADWALHDRQDGNPHVHILLTVRGINSDGAWSTKSEKFINWIQMEIEFPLSILRQESRRLGHVVASYGNVKPCRLINGIAEKMQRFGERHGQNSVINFLDARQLIIGAMRVRKRKLYRQFMRDLLQDK